jgi:hypothetical protein
MHQPDEKDEELYRKLAEKLEAGARKIGLYVRDFGIATHNPADPDSPPVAIAAFLVGDVALSDRVQDPGKEDINKEVHRMGTQLQQEEFETLRERLRKEAEGEDS